LKENAMQEFLPVPHIKYLKKPVGVKNPPGTLFVK
jgi:hypothetical protein